MTDINDALIERATQAVDGEWTRPQHGCDGDPDKCARYCPYPAYECMGMGELRDAAVRAVLEAVADDLRADAWDDGYVRGVLDTTSDLEPADNPYRQRADQIEEDE